MSFDSKDIFVYMEERRGALHEGSLQLLGKSRFLVAQIPGFQVVAVLLGQNNQTLADQAFDAGADKVILVNHPKLASYSTQHHTRALVDIIQQYKPDSVLLAATAIGRDLAPRAAARVNTGLTADATQIEVDSQSEHPGTLLVTRPAFGGNLFGTIICPKTRPQMSTIRPHVFDELKETHQGPRELVEHQLDFEEKDQVRLVRSLPKPEKTIDISRANVILSAGRGLKDDFDQVVATARSIGATPASSRALVDAGIAPKALQVGQTGTTVKPKVYIALGISGAVQHTAGMDKAELIIAINSDPKAAIFSLAQVGIVADAKKVLPLIRDEVLKQLAK